MTHAATHISPSSAEPTPTDWMARHRAKLDRTVDLAAKLTELIVAEAAPGEAAASAAAFERTVRTMRQTIELLQRSERAPAPGRGTSVLERRRETTRRHVMEEMEAQIEQAELVGLGETADLCERLQEQVDQPAFEQALDEQPPEEIIAALCDAIGVLVPESIDLDPAVDPEARRQVRGEGAIRDMSDRMLGRLVDFRGRRSPKERGPP